MKRGAWALLCVAILLPPAAARAQAPAPTAAEKVFADFEDGSTEGWTTEHDVKMSVEADARASAKKWLRVELNGENWPGARLTTPPPDWSAFRAFRVSMFNPTDHWLEVSFRVDDATSVDYESRYNWERGIKLRPGANEVEVSLASLRMGTPGSRGLDVEQIKLVSFYRTFPMAPVPFCLDRLRLAPGDAAAPERLVLADFETAGKVRAMPRAGATAQVEERPDGVDGSALRVAFPARTRYPGVLLTGFPADWLSYDLLTLDVLCAKEGPIPPNLYLSASDSDGHSQWLCTALEPGLNRLRIPVELIALPSLSRMHSLVLFLDYPMKDMTIHVDNLRLERQSRLAWHRESVHMDYAAEDGVRLSFRDLGLEEQNPTFGALAWAPLATGETRAVRASGRRSTVTGFALPPEAFEGMKPGAPIEVWGYFRARNCTYFTREELLHRPGRLTTLEFNDLTPFGF